MRGRVISGAAMRLKAPDHVWTSDDDVDGGDGVGAHDGPVVRVTATATATVGGVLGRWRMMIWF